MKLTISQEEYQKLRNAGQSKEDIIAKYSEGSKGTLSRFAEGVTKFVGAEGIKEQYGASIARQKLKMEGKEDVANFVENPSLKKVVGSAIQTGANFIPGAGTGSSLLAKTALGAGTGYAMDVGANLQLDRDVPRSLQPGIGTVVGGALPSLGKIIGYLGKDKTAGMARILEEINMRLTPVEKQNLEKKGDDIAKFLAQKKITGSPEVRSSKLNVLYDDMERQVQNMVDKVKVTIPSTQLIDDLKKIPDTFLDDPELQAEANNTIGRLIQSLSEKRGDNLSLGAINNLKRNYMKRAFAKNATDVLSDSRLAIANTLNGILRKNVKGLASLNDEYGKIIASRRILQKASTRSEIGLVGKLTGASVGGLIGNAVGGPVGGAVGVAMAQPVGKAVAGTATRSTLGAGLQSISDIAGFVEKIPTDQAGNISKKALIAYLESLKSDQ